MAWQRRATETMADILRFFVKGALILDAIALAVASVYIMVKLCWHTVQFLDRVLFAGPW